MGIKINGARNGNRMASMGRKKKKLSEKKSSSLKIMMTAKERAEMEEAAATDEMETSTWVRRKILELIRQQSKK